MTVLVDTSVWSLAFRRRGGLGTDERRVVQELLELIDRTEAHMAGCIRQEVLSGIPSRTQFEALREKLHAFVDVPTDRETYERAAEFYNTCRSRGVQGSHIDFLICAIADRHDLSIFTLDRDFGRYAEPCGITLFT